MIKRESENRKPAPGEHKRKMLLTYSLVGILSVILVFAGLALNIGYTGVAFIAAAVLLNAVYWLVYYLRCKSLHRVGKYPSLAFSRVQLFILAFTQAVQKFLVTSNVLTPTEDMTSEIEEKSGERETEHGARHK